MEDGGGVRVGLVHLLCDKHRLENKSCVHCGERIVPDDKETSGFGWRLWAARAVWLFGDDTPVSWSL